MEGYDAGSPDYQTWIEISLGGTRGQGLSTLVDARFREAVTAWAWGVNAAGYARRNIYEREAGMTKGKCRTITLHRYVMHLAQAVPLFGRDVMVDHINRNRLDNRLENLRLVTPGQNSMNRSHDRRNTSGFRGVFWDKKDEIWRVAVRFNGTLHHLGRFTDPREAARAYDAKARELFGDHAVLNFPENSFSYLRNSPA